MIEWAAEYRPLLATFVGVAALLVMILRYRMNAFVALILVSILSAVGAGLSPDAAYDAVTKGVGGTLGFIAVVIGLGAVFGVLLEASGAVQALAGKLSKGGDPGQARWTLSAVGLIAAIPVFFDVALIVLAPIVFALSRVSGRAPLVFGLPLLAGLATAHAFIPPTPGPLAVTQIIGADLGLVTLLGVPIGIITVIVSGPLLSGLLDRAGWIPAGRAPSLMETGEDAPAPPVPGRLSAGAAGALIILPLLLILVGTAAKYLPDGTLGKMALLLIGHPFAALIIACGATLHFVRPNTDEQRADMRARLGRALEPAGAVVLVTGAGGAFKQVLVETGAGVQLAASVAAVGLTPLLAGYILALVVRVAQGSATVAMVTAAGLTAPLVELASISAVDQALVVIAIAAGASALSHVNDSGFWLVSRVFNINEAETLATWTVTTTVLSVTGGVAALLLSVLL